MIEFRHIGKSFAGTPAVQDINLSVGKGELFGLIGPDGAGKSTLFRMLVTLLLPDEGEITFNGHNVVDDYSYVRSHVGYMPGTFALYQDLSVEENLHFFATLFGTSIEENYHLIEGIYKQLEPFKKRRAGALSGGMKQKLALSCALIHKPLVLVLDEPTTGVDAVSRKEFWEMLQKLRDDGLTILVSTAYMDEATLCDRVALIQKGHLLRIDTPQGIIKRFGKPLYRLSGIGVQHFLPLLRTLPQVHSAQPFGDSVHITLTAAEYLDEVEKQLRQAGYSEGLQPVTPGIEDCFIDLMLQADA